MKTVLYGVMDKKITIGLDNGLAPNGWQAIIQTIGDSVQRCMHPAQGQGELTNIKRASPCLIAIIRSKLQQFD